MDDADRHSVTLDVHAARTHAGSTPAAALPLHVPDCTPEELQAWIRERRQPNYRARQILEWTYRKRATSFDEMSNLPLALRRELNESACIDRGVIEADSRAGDGTRKLLLRWSDDTRAETVWIPTERRNTVCISSQVGCPVGCRFCASGLDGVERNLTAGEIVEQALHVERLIAAEHARGSAPSCPPQLTHVVMMGMGEPLANYDALVKALRILNSPDGLNIGARRITVSTVGLPSQIRKLAREGLQFNLALSLHAPDDDLRRELIPWGKGVGIEHLLSACEDYFRQTGREITLEYVLLAGVNDQPRHAAGLAKIARRLRANVNLLRYNPVPGLDYRRPTAEQAFDFQQRLRRHDVNVHVRTSRGRDVDAACGQLRRHTIAGPSGVRGPAAGANDPGPDGGRADDGSADGAGSNRAESRD